MTYLKEGFDRQPFRVLKIAPATNYRTATITAQIHDDAWYADSNGQVTSAAAGGAQGAPESALPRPLMGTVLDDNGDIQFGVEESATHGSDGTVETNVTVSFVSPGHRVAARGPGDSAAEPGGDGGGGRDAEGRTDALLRGVRGGRARERRADLSFIVRASDR